MKDNFDLIIIGGGILGTSISYLLSFLNKSKKIAVIEQEYSVAQHTSGTKHWKSSFTILYTILKRKNYLQMQHFKVMKCGKNILNYEIYHSKKMELVEVALDEKGIKVLEKYLKWGKQNGLEEKDMKLMDKSELKRNRTRNKM